MELRGAKAKESFIDHFTVPIFISSLITLIGVLAYIGLTHNPSGSTIAMSQSQSHSLIFTLLAFSGAALVALVLLISASLYIRNNNILLTRKNDALEERVAQRTQELTKINHSLTQAKNELDALLTSIPLAVIGTNEDGIIISANPQSHELLGYAPNELIGMEVDLLVPKSFRKNHANARQSLSDNKITNLKPNRSLFALAKNGEEIDVDITVNAFNVDGKWIAVTSLRDIREQIQAEQAQQRLQMQLANASKMETIGHLAGGIAHDFNNILAGIKGFSELALRANNDGDKKISRYLQSIQNSSQRASELVKQILAFSRGDTQSRCPVQPLPVISEAAAMLRAAFPASITINQDFTDEDLIIEIDPTHLHQLIMNLAINAKDALGNKGVIDICLSHAHIQHTCSSCFENIDGEFAVIEVRDNGHGISSEHIKQIFDPFFSTKAVGAGSGLGLSMVHGITHSYDGHIVIDSSPNKGTAVKLLFPVNAHILNNADKNSAESIKQHLAQCSGHIMVVDDEQIVTLFMRELIEEWGFNVTTFNDPREALNAIKSGEQRFDITISDQIMPHILGTELAAEFKKIRPEMPFILFSGFSQDVDETNFRDFGISAYLNKPVNSDLLHRYLKDFIAAQPQQKQPRHAADY